MKGSNAFSGSMAKAGDTVQPSDSPQRSPRHSPPSRAADHAAGSFALAGRSDLPDPANHAYRQDLADVALAGRVIASHYAEPLLRHLVEDAPLLADPGGETLDQLAAGDEMWVLDCSLGWAWGYAGADRRVGYVTASALQR
ncbi:MAG: hypothetical protein ABR588_04730 [Sphingomicrobium sp.]|nr:hypothetical protein [Sphingomonadales bacterium]